MDKKDRISNEKDWQDAIVQETINNYVTGDTFGGLVRHDHKQEHTPATPDGQTDAGGSTVARILGKLINH